MLYADCYETALGMENGYITDDQITASSYYTPKIGCCYPYYARLNHNTRWNADHTQSNHWLKIDLRKNRTVTGLVTQGGNEWVTTINVKYERPAGSEELHYVTDDDGVAKVNYNLVTELSVQYTFST